MLKKLFKNKTKSRYDESFAEEVEDIKDGKNALKKEKREEKGVIREKYEDEITEIVKEDREEETPIIPVIPKTDLQQLLDENYPKNQRANIRELDISNQWQNLDTTGSLKLESFINLEKLNCSNNGLNSLDLSDCLELWYLNCENNQLKNLNLTNCFNLQYLLCSNNQLTRLNLTNYYKLEKLVFNNNQLSTLDFSNLSSLRNLSFVNNQLVNVNINNCPSITEIDFSNNSLVSVENLLMNLSSNKLETLNIFNNKFSRQDLSCFSRFVNLRDLFISNNNRFYGSLEPLQNLGKLEVLKIDNTDINLGLEYLPNSIKEFSCASSLGTENKVKSLRERLVPIVFLNNYQIESKINGLVQQQRNSNNQQYEKYKRLGNHMHAGTFNKDEYYYKALKDNYYDQEKKAKTSFTGQEIQSWKNSNGNELMKLKKKENVSIIHSPVSSSSNESEENLIPSEKEIENLTKDQVIQQLKEKNQRFQSKLEEVKGLNEEKSKRIEEKEKLITFQKEKILELEYKLADNPGINYKYESLSQK